MLVLFITSFSIWYIMTFSSMVKERSRLVDVTVGDFVAHAIYGWAVQMMVDIEKFIGLFDWDRLRNFWDTPVVKQQREDYR